VKRLLVLLVLSLVLIPTTAQAKPPCIERSWIPRHMPTAEKEWRVVRLAECATAHWWPGHARTMLDIAWRESHYNPFAENPYSSASGLYQHLLTYWPGRAAAFLNPHWFKTWPVPWWNARAQTIVTVLMMRNQGGACPAWC
jgi:hypothetical protein